MKKVLFALVASLAMNASQANPAIQTSDRMCLALADLAGSVAARMADGLSEEDSMDIIDKLTQEDPSIRTPIKAIAGYVYIMQLEKADARRIIYLKCKSGDYTPQKMAAF